MFTPGDEVIEVEAEEGGLFYVAQAHEGASWTVWLDRTSTGNNPSPCETYTTKEEAIESARKFPPLSNQCGPYTGPEARAYLLRTRRHGAVAGESGPPFASYPNEEEAAHADRVNVPGVEP